MVRYDYINGLKGAIAQVFPINLSAYQHTSCFRHTLSSYQAGALTSRSTSHATLSTITSRGRDLSLVTSLPSSSTKTSSLSLTLIAIYLLQQQLLRDQFVPRYLRTAQCLPILPKRCQIGEPSMRYHRTRHSAHSYAACDAPDVRCSNLSCSSLPHKKNSFAPEAQMRHVSNAEHDLERMNCSVAIVASSRTWMHSPRSSARKRSP